MRLALGVPLLIWVLALAGCQSAGKKGAAAPSPGGADPVRFPGAGGKAAAPGPVDPILSGAAPLTGQALLAGRVLDPYGRGAANSSIKLVAVGAKDAGEAPLDIAASAEGYFTIPGLKPGADYKLIARSKTGERVMAGITQTTAPNVRVVILVRDDLVGGDATDAPATKGGKAKSTALGMPEAMSLWKPEASADAGARTEPGPRISLEPDVPAIKVPPPAATTEPKFTPGVVEAPKTWPPVLDITPKPAPGAAPATSSPSAARVPSCVLVGKQLVNFALNDINGEPWQFRTSRKGKVVLIDFWGTECIPCRQSLPAMKDLHLRYGGQGLEVIGIAYENGGTPEEQAHRVQGVCSKAGITYRQLLGAGASCPVRTQFGVRFIPTLVLLDENGWILWRHEGRPDRAALDELERWLQRRLPGRPS